MKFFGAVFIDITIMAGLIYSHINDVSWMYNVTHFVLWFVSIIIIIGFMAGTIENTRSSIQSKTIGVGVDIAMVLTLASIGSFVLATVYAIAVMAITSIKFKKVV